MKTQLRTGSQKKFRDLKLVVYKMVEDQPREMAGSFSIFQKWLTSNHPEIIQQAEDIASDIRLWRDTQDVLRQLWEGVSYN